MKSTVCVVLIVLLMGCSSFGTTKDRWSDRYEAQWKIVEFLQNMQNERIKFLTQMVSTLDGEARGFLIAMIAMSGDYRDYADVLSTITPPDKTSGEILATGIAEALPFAIFGATVGWMNNEWARSNRGPTTPLTDNRVSYHAGGDMGFGSWNPVTTTTTTSSFAPVVP